MWPPRSFKQLRINYAEKNLPCIIFYLHNATLRSHQWRLCKFTCYDINPAEWSYDILESGLLWSYELFRRWGPFIIFIRLLTRKEVTFTSERLSVIHYKCASCVCVCACVCVSALCKVSSWEACIYETLQSHSNGFITYLTYMVDVCVRARVRACMHACVCSLMHARVSTCVSATAATLCLRLLPRSALPLSTVWGDNRKKKASCWESEES